ncbi:MAG: hydantoinase B/oxoprolinase family protein [Gemmatimonas sp.]|jgi:N-methylhydantoinase B|uniref:hydantoinase B/oxoprolinase family protein n=1 Tax=Gemmatimonas sp. TaxID=1962908 RepID=UPI00391EF04A|nr:hydantoinase B/oxoprolinase family protein [Gemmatimonadota bacterium]
MASPAFDALELTVFSQGVAMLAEEMGGLLERSSISPNIRERRDASCALFDAAGRMVAQAAHIPVHLGAMPEAVAAVRAAGAGAGDLFLLNDPSHGGSHLPDLTMVEVIAHPHEPDRIIGYAAVRAHHADVGGMSPGSMPFGATELFQEGLIVPPVRLEVRGVPQSDVLALVLANVRTPAEREGDLRAQRAACAAGRRGWQALALRMGEAALHTAVEALLDYTERRVRARLAILEGAEGHAADALEGDGVSEIPIPVVIAARVRERTLHLDLTGTSPAVKGNVNAPPAVARAAAVFVLRVLCDDDVPVNDGVARALALTIPNDCVANAKRPSAVAAGNVELSQRLTDVCFAALANAAASIGVADLVIPASGQGTMNNVTLGGPGWSFYETLGGGQGASLRGDGPTAVHVGMSNTRNTPVESLERAYPLRVVEYAVRRGSGGPGWHTGGDGVVRRYQALGPCTATLLTERRRVAPPGANGGGEAKAGINRLNDDVLPAKTRVAMQAGDVLTIETPGGGGWGVAGEA